MSTTEEVSTGSVAVFQGGDEVQQILVGVVILLITTLVVGCFCFYFTTSRLTNKSSISHRIKARMKGTEEAPHDESDFADWKTMRMHTPRARLQTSRSLPPTPTPVEIPPLDMSIIIHEDPMNDNPAVQARSERQRSRHSKPPTSRNAFESTILQSPHQPVLVGISARERPGRERRRHRKHKKNTTPPFLRASGDLDLERGSSIEIYDEVPEKSERKVKRVGFQDEHRRSNLAPPSGLRVSGEIHLQHTASSEFAEDRKVQRKRLQSLTQDL
ncbi:MAG: hypothetical protein KVP17_001809 [Porospora cf. gigantea B]|uniref:uncharacterized protein n=1 Tax=Porospora cf. gigantea B TaxID=2853592 RepID=UPI003571B45B|nr:MAG: hypothetical protein KVP17_001809 [Porospora cf. gigantea B]